MYLKQTKRNGRVYLSVMQNYRRNGKVHAKTIERIGYADYFADHYSDPVAHFKQYVAELNERAAQRDVPVHLTIARDAQIAQGEGGAVSLGSAIALGYADALEMGRFFNAGETQDRPDKGLGRAFELLVCERMQHAVPVHETWSAKAKFPRMCAMELGDMYRGFGRVAQSERAFIDQLNSRYEAVHGKRALDNVRLVLSNYVFAWPAGDTSRGPDEMEGQTEARLCLVIDGAGIPLTYRIVPRDLSVDRVLAVIDELKAESGAKRITLVAAQLRDALEIVPGVLARGDGFVLLMGAEAVSADLYDWAADEAGYALTRNRAYRIKSRVGELEETMARSLRARRTDQGATHPRVKEIALRPAKGTSAQSFFIVSSEVGSSDAAIFNIYRELWRVHEPFQVISADFIAPPYPVDARVHLRAHFVICYAAFFALRVMREDMGWTRNAAQVADALVHMEGAYLDENWYLFNYRTPVTDDIQRAVGVDVGRRLLSRADIRSVTATVRRRALHQA